MTSRRSTERFDYKLFSTTGRKESTRPNQSTKPTMVQPNQEEEGISADLHATGLDPKEKSEPNKESTTRDPIHPTREFEMTAQSQEIFNDLQLSASLLHDEILDTIEDNSPDTISPERMQTCAAKLENLRKDYRSAHRKIQAMLPNELYEQRYEKPYLMTVSDISTYIRQVNEHFRKQDSDILNTNQQKTDFLIEDINRTMKVLKASIECNSVSIISNTDLKQRKSLLESQTKELKDVSTKLQDLISLKPPIGTYSELKKNYTLLFDQRVEYENKINSEMKLREIDKLETFNKSKLNIKLQTFTGYDSSIDIYTFIEEFKKLYSEAPQSLQAKLLKNNHLGGQALSLVQSIDTISEAWERLKSVFGDRQILLQHKLSELYNINETKSRDSMKVIDFLSKVTNTMRDLMHLASTHNIEDDLYHSNALHEVVQMLGEHRMMRWLTVSCETPKTGKFKWKQLIEFLDKEMKVHQQKAVIQKCTSNKQPDGIKPAVKPKRSTFNSYTKPPDPTVCQICGATNHVQTNGPRGTKLVQYFACKVFVDMTPEERYQTLKTKNLCYQCLYPGARRDQGRHVDGNCQRDFICQHPHHQPNQPRKHVLVCNEHKNHQQNLDILEHYRARCISRQPVPTYSKEIKLTFLSCDETSNPNAIFMLQTIQINKATFTIFYDTGCCDFISRHQAITQLGSRANQEFAGPITMGGVGGISSQSNHGIYTVKLPLASGEDATFRGACLDQITQKFPMYKLNGEVINDLRADYTRCGGNPSQLPSMSKEVGGHTDFMIAIQYLRYFPEEVFKMPSGLTIYRSCFKNVDGSTGVIGGPHRVFNNIKQHHPSNRFIQEQHQLFNMGYHVNPDVRLLGYTVKPADIYVPSDSPLEEQSEIFRQSQEAGSELQFRCINCRGCQRCKELSTTDEVMSVKEEVEQDVINKSIHIDVTNQTSNAFLPLLHDASTYLAPNRKIALQVYNQQLRRLSKHPDDKADVLKSEHKLQKLGYVEYVKNLHPDVQQSLLNNDISNFIPWRAVWKENSISTPCRVVFDASMKTESGYALNDIIAKGRNNMNKLVEIFLRWRGHAVGIHTDIAKMYNSIHLDKTHWCLQRYLWEENLDPSKPPEEKVIKTLIYGVKSSGNQAERALRETASIFKEEHPKVHKTITEDVYVDDCITGQPTQPEASKLADNLEIVVNRGGFGLKGFTFSNQHPQESLTSDGESVSVAGHKWMPKEDQISLDIQQLNFSKKYRGKKPQEIKEVPTNLTRRQCVSKASEVFDISGLLTPITATMKMDLHNLVKRKMDWDDILPNELRSLWSSHFEMIQELKSIRFNRAVVPPDASNLNLTTLDFGDASQDLVCASIYARFHRKQGDYSCQLIFARSRLVPDDYTQPRGELYAALICTHTGEVVKKAFKSTHTGNSKFTDSQITLYWITNKSLQLKQWVRNRVNEIHRLTNIDNWQYVQSNDMIADQGTRRCLSIADVDKSSEWINGFPWMRQDQSHFPALTASKITLSQAQLEQANREVKNPSSHFNVYHTNLINDEFLNEAQRRYKFSEYLVDPNRYRLSKVLRIVAIILRFIKCCRSSIKQRLKTNQAMTTTLTKDELPRCIPLTEEDLTDAENYFYRKATQEIKQFVKRSKIGKISKEKDGILYYIGRILPTDNITVAGNMTSTMKDLTSTTFCVPIIDKHSPVAISIINDIHWHSPVKHSGIETTWRHILKKAFILEGRSLVQLIRSSCERCRFINKKTIDIQMGPLSQDNLVIAPAFYISQADLAGPFTSYSQHHRRTTVKIWLIIFCCATTTAVNIKVMEDYSTTSFLQSFTRFSCQVGYPWKLLIDEGGQLVKGCETMKLNFTDIAHQLHKDFNINFETCPVGGHNHHGRVERKIREVRSSLEKTLNKDRLSIIQWETIAAVIANSINNMPIAVGSNKSNFEMADLITPNRLLLGRNNERSPSATLTVENDFDKMIRANQKLYNAWFDCWLVSHVPNLVEQPKWFKSDVDVKVGDIVLFTKQDSVISSNYQYGKISQVFPDRDGKIRKVGVEYQNASENTKRLTKRSVRSLVMIHSINELDISKELYKCAKH